MIFVTVGTHEQNFNRLIEKIDVLKKEDKIIIHNALKKINSEYHQILWLVYFEKFTNKDIESIMNKNSRQIANLLYRAKKSLKDELQKEGFDYEKL